MNIFPTAKLMFSVTGYIYTAVTMPKLGPILCAGLLRLVGSRLRPFVLELQRKAYLKSQDPRSRDGRLVDYYAPDCVRGNDGKYYLYYFAAGPNTSAFGPMSVAVSESPDGPFEYLSDIKYKNGAPVLKFLTNDPAVINDNGRIWLYYGWGSAEISEVKCFLRSTVLCSAN